MRPALILSNGPPAAGKSTLAERLVDRRPLALNLDVDLIRGQLGRWAEQPTDAGLAARALALSMARTHLNAGLDVVVPQLLARAGFIEQLERVAGEQEATFVEVALIVSRVDAIATFEQRRQEATRSTHRDAVELVDRSEHPDLVGDLCDRLRACLDTRPQCVRIAALRASSTKRGQHCDAASPSKERCVDL